MPTYEYECTRTGEPFERILPIARYAEPQLCACGAEGRKLVSRPNFVLKGDDWPGKANLINNQMRKKNERLDAKQNEQKRDAPVARLRPNVGGEEVGSWSEASKLASDRGLDSSSYQPMVAAESKAAKA